MPSLYANTVPLLIKDIDDLLLGELNLPTPFKSTDPLLGEAYGKLSGQDLVDIDNGLRLNCLFIASSAFTSAWAATSWAIATGLNLDDLTLKVKGKVDNRGILANFSKSGSITTGRPRSPLKAVAGQQATVWVVDVLMPCYLDLLITRDIVCGHR